MRYTLRQIQCFMALSQELHFGHAASRANITQPALSRQIVALEEAVGAQLVTRGGGSVSLTAAGSAFLAGCRESLDVLAAAERRAVLISQGAEGSIRIGYTDFAISSRLPELLVAYRRAVPGVVVEPIQASTLELLERLERNQIDVAFVTGPIERAGILTAPFTSNRLIGVLYEGHPLAARRALVMTDFDGEDLVLGIERFWSNYLDHLDKVFRQFAISPRVVERGYNSEGLFGLVAAQLGITIYPDCVFNYVRRGLVLREIENLAVRVPTQIAWRDATPAPDVEGFIRFARDASDGA